MFLLQTLIVYLRTRVLKLYIKIDEYIFTWVMYVKKVC